MHVSRSGSRPLLTFLTLLLLALPWLLAATAAGATEPSDSGGTDARVLRKELRHIDKVLRRADVRDAKRRVFKREPWARADVRSLTVLNTALEAGERDEILQRTRTFLERAAKDGERSFLLELDRLDGTERGELARQLGCTSPSEAEEDSAYRKCILDLYRRDARTLLEARMDHFGRADGAEELRARLERFRGSLRESIKTRGRLRRKILGAPAFPAVWAWRKIHSAHEYEGPQWIGYGERYRMYVPEVAAGTAGFGEGTEREAALLARHAPVLVQEVAPASGPEAADYEPEVDRIGSFRLEAEDGARGRDDARTEPRPVVDVSRPASYAYVTRLPLHGHQLTQLVYTFWYPEHPKLKGFVDLEAGEIEGITLRITLDAAGEPRLYETIYNCGCFHRLFVDRRLEEAAAAQYGPPQGDRPYSIQRSVDGRIDWIVPELVEVDPRGRPFFFVRSGFHLPAAVRYELPEGFLREDGTPKGEAVPYRLHPYRDLEHQPWEGGWASIFTDTGLVRGAGRLEGVLLSPLGLYRAGQPRQRGTQLIHFDQADFDDPAIYDTYLRLPEELFHTTSTAADANAGGDPTSRAGLPSPPREASRQEGGTPQEEPGSGRGRESDGGRESDLRELR